MCGSDSGPAVWDVYLLRGPATAGTSGSGSSGSGSGSGSGSNYGLQVLGRAGEVPAEPRVVSVQLSSARWLDSERLKFKLQVGGVKFTLVGGGLPDGALQAHDLTHTL